MIYADEDFYKEKYLLGRKPVISTGFPFYARQASQVIDRYTFDRLVAQMEVPEEVRMCCCELAEAAYQHEKVERIHLERLQKRSEPIPFPTELRRR